MYSSYLNNKIPVSPTQFSIPGMTGIPVYTQKSSFLCHSNNRPRACGVKDRRCYFVIAQVFTYLSFPPSVPEIKRVQDCTRSPLTVHNPLRVRHERTTFQVTNFLRNISAFCNDFFNYLPSYVFYNPSKNTSVLFRNPSESTMYNKNSSVFRALSGEGWGRGRSHQVFNRSLLCTSSLKATTHLPDWLRAVSKK